MVTFLMVLVVISMLATLGIMFAGMLGLVRSEDGGGARSNKLMRLRVVMQGVTLVLFLLLVLLKA
ncbi:twin transmembrane helix small protein [Roseomonas stagni]|uniref:Twin transmembrane helix small protein n=1 Tax=Falsiroseomonas algicola TaxID=2716930 RepID=A0A6M1LSD2_9PROT|nr:twin transmembrane helix small protein [Falsiroseomonas algicola]NGM22899.1 twin transmembrane helix small protein [Falsiroseomonas algicola]